MKSILSVLIASSFLSLSNLAYSQCNTGEVEISIQISTDDWGYEVYWELLPSGNNCGVGTIFAGGNPDVGCNGGGARTQPNGGTGGYANNGAFTEGPWCLLEGTDYDIVFVDDYGDGGGIFEVESNATHMYDFTVNPTLSNATFTFNTNGPPVIVIDPIPNIIPSYYGPGSSNTLQTVNATIDGVSDPTDLDFHPITGELWVLNRGTYGTGGSTVRYTDPGKGTQAADYKKDYNSWHFMNLPTALAFSTNGNFATSSGCYDANHDVTFPTPGAFTGPALWPSDPAIYSYDWGNGSHLDMLHESPYCMGIAWQRDNRFWITDGYTGDVVMYDFGGDHGPGQADHDDGIVLRYPDIAFNWINDQIPSHLKIQNGTNWLYVVIGGSQRIVRFDISTGTLGGTPAFSQTETLAQYGNMNGVTTEDVVTTGLFQPCGIDIIDNRMIVSDHLNGDIIIYDITTMPAVEVGRIQTGDSDVMGVVIGPEGFIWYVDGAANKVVKVEPGSIISSIEETENLRFSVYPNPASQYINIKSNIASGNSSYQVIDLTGRVLLSGKLNNNLENMINVASLPVGTYALRISDSESVRTKQILIIR